MIKLTNLQIVLFDSPIVADLLNSDKRHFPIEDSFKLADIVETLTPKIKAYRKTVKKIIDKNRGSTNNKGELSFGSKEDSEKANEEIEKLNAMTVECDIDKVKMNEEWPKLNIAEARALRPVILVK